MPIPRIVTGLITALAFFCLPATYAQENTEPELKIEIRQSQFHDDFTQRELRIYRIIGSRLTLVSESFDDPEAEVSLEHLIDTASLRLLKNTIERNRVMEVEPGCERISRDTRTKMKTEIRIVYNGQEITCYSFDQPFSSELEEVLTNINRLLPAEQHKMAIPSYNPRIEVGQ